MDSYFFTKNFIKVNGELSDVGHKVKILSALLLWEQKKDARILDKMVVYCTQNDISMTPEMTKALSELAALRLNGQLTSSKKNHIYQETKEFVFLQMWKMIYYCSTSEDLAAINGIKILKLKSQKDKRIKPIKGNTLKKEYRKWLKENIRFTSGMIGQLPYWDEKQISEYLNQYEFISLEDWEIGVLR